MSTTDTSQGVTATITAPATAASPDGPPTDTVPARDRDRIAELVCGHMATRAVAAAAALGLADLIGDAEPTAAELAGSAGCDPDALLRLLRSLAALGLLAEQSAGRFRLTSAGALLRTDRPDSMHSFVSMCTDPAMLDAWRDLDRSVRTGDRAFDQVFGTDFFAHLGADPVLSERFNTAMRQSARVAAQVLPGAFDFGSYGTIADVGGGDGTLLAAVLRAHPRVRGFVFDTPEGTAQARPTLAEAGLAERCATRTGDFFVAVPSGADVYMLKSILHDWDDERAVRILRNCRSVVPAHGRLLIIEPVLPGLVGAARTALPYLSDLNMLVNLGGKERTGDDFSALCGAAGFELTGITSLAPARYSLIEAVPA